MPEIVENTYFAGRYKLISRLGAGGFSVVWLAEDTMAGDTQIALKIYAPDKGLDKDGIDNFRKEYAITLNLNHSSLLSSKHFDVSEGSPYLIMQYLSNGSALKLVENIDEKRLGKFIYEVSAGLEYLHDHEPSIVHQDIKPDNVLISAKGNFLLTDFGISTRVRRTLVKSAGNVGYSGTIAYVPPERYMRNPRPQPEGDVFAFGIMLFEMMTGYLPWNEQGGLGFIGSQIIPPIDVDGFSDTVKSLAIACISFKPEDRPTAAEITLFAQSFVQQGFWDPKVMPKTVHAVFDVSEQEVNERISDALKKEADNTEKRKEQEVEKANIVAEKKKIEAAEAKNVKKQKDADALKKKLEQDFKDTLAKADEEFVQKSYNNARDFYKSAFKIKEDKYVKKQIVTCDEHIKKEQEIKRKKYNETQTQNLLIKAESDFNKGKYSSAKKQYQQVLLKDSNNIPSQERLKEVELIFSNKKIENKRKLIKVGIPILALGVIAVGIWWFISRPVFPVANFEANNYTVEEGETVQFRSTSENAKTYSWQFMEGNPPTSVSKNPMVKFDKPGKYNVELIVRNGDGDDSKYIKNCITVVEKNPVVVNKELAVVNKKVTPKKAVIPMPSADFSANRTSVIVGNSIKFSNKSKNADRIEWTFDKGNPNKSTEANPEVVYKHTGKHKVTIIAYNEAGKKIKSKNNYVTVSKDIKKPVAKFEADTTTIFVGGEIQFRDLSSFADNRKWSFDGGEPQQSDEQNPIVYYNEIGSYGVQINVSNKKGKDTYNDSLYVTVLERPEVVLANKFKAVVASADVLYNKKSFNKALVKYKEANGLIPNDNYVTNQIVEINSVNNVNSEYDELIYIANREFDNDEYDKAVSNYKMALKTKSGEDYPSKMINRIDKIRSVENVAFSSSKNEGNSFQQILTSKYGYTAIVKITVGEVYKDNKIKLNISTEWKDKKGRPITDVDEKIAIVNTHVIVSSDKVNVENFNDTDYMLFSNRATLKLRVDKSFEGGIIIVKFNFVEFVKESHGVPVTLAYKTKDPIGNLDISFDMKKYYKSKY